ncbi:unnamed protein product [Didymodactylos carnosus]|uniref:non-specific serine/threonine protein kinase n=1 Tax=Didymodactylos carnosus TaxID=1234261 RepID=A0A814V8J7_9BILA|nr:unnamed protein product [Didymodactylos carnosus]CAF1184775.1 unnamed protein product [Didymodactylos carnosus]CAF3600456.1 unnamed protein product [Didymodactylos carnosus]CAF3949078.1 unnamed protein product [Didymodactylos carnosus]
MLATQIIASSQPSKSISTLHSLSSDDVIQNATVEHLSIMSTIENQHHHHQQQQQQHQHIKIGKYYLEKTIGKGNFAVVKLATHCETNQKVAIKIIDKCRLDANEQKKLEREIAVMKSLSHPYIIRLYEVMESKSLIYLVTEYAANGEVLDLLIHEKRLSECKAREKFKQLVIAVDYVHSMNIVHRDLKAENLLLDSNNNIKVADFGFATVFETNSHLRTFCGSPPYAAPELFQCLPYNGQKVDVWSLGVLLYVFVCGHLPFESNNIIELRKRVLSGQFRLPFYINADCSSLITNMLNIDPDKRYSIQDVIRHPWMSPCLSDPDFAAVLNSQNLIQPPVTDHINDVILNQAESLGYNRSQILKSVSGNSYDSDAAIYHLLLEKFQQKFHIDNKNNNHNQTTSDSTNDTIPTITSSPFEHSQLFTSNYTDGPSKSNALDLLDVSNNNQIARRSTAPVLFDTLLNQGKLVYSKPNPAHASFRPELDPCDLDETSLDNNERRNTITEIRVENAEEELENESDEDETSDEEDEQDEVECQTSREHYFNTTHGLRRHTIGKPNLLSSLGHVGPIPSLAAKVRFIHNSQKQQQSLTRLDTPSIEPSILINRLSSLQQQKSNDLTASSDKGRSPPALFSHHQRNPHSNSYNGFKFNSTMAMSDDYNNLHEQGQKNNFNNCLLAPPMSNNFNMNRRASDSGAHLQMFQQLHDVPTVSFGAIQSTTPSSSNRSSRGSITRGLPGLQPPVSTLPSEEDEGENVARYLQRGKRHTVCDQTSFLTSKPRRGRDSTKEIYGERSFSRRASDTNPNPLTPSIKAHLEHLYNTAVGSQSNDGDEDVTTSSLQELQKLQRQVQKYPQTSQFTIPNETTRRTAAPSPTNASVLHMIQEEHHLPTIDHYPSLPNSLSTISQSTINRTLSSDSVNNQETSMDYECDHRQTTIPTFSYSHYNNKLQNISMFANPFFLPQQPPLYFTSPMFLEHLNTPSTTSYSP